MPNPDASPSLERYTPREDQLRSQLHFEHLHRYHFAAQFVNSRRVLDIASGSGYGAALLGRAGAESVLGVDIAVDAIHLANQLYASPRVRFSVGDCASIPLPDKSVDVVTSFETIEHIENQDKFFSEIDRVLSDSGILILSSPDRDFYRRALASNPFHVRELTLAELQSTVSRWFSHFQTFGQRLVAGSLILSLGSGSGNELSPLSLVEAGAEETRRHRSIDAPPYLVVVASRQPLPRIQGELYEEEGVTPIIWDVYERGQTLVGENLDQKIRELGEEIERRGLWGLGLQKQLDEALLEKKHAIQHAEEQQLRLLAENEAALAAATRRFAEMRLSLENAHADELKAVIANASTEQNLIQQKLDRAAEAQAAVTLELDRKIREVDRIARDKEAELAAAKNGFADVRLALEREHALKLKTVIANAAADQNLLLQKLDQAAEAHAAVLLELDRKTREVDRIARDKEAELAAAKNGFADVRLALEREHALKLKTIIANAANEQHLLHQKLDRAVEAQAVATSELDRQSREIARILSDKEAALASLESSATEVRSNLERTHIAQLDAMRASAASQHALISSRLDEALREQNELIAEVERSRLGARLAIQRESLLRAEMEERVERFKQQIAQAGVDASKVVAKVEQDLGKQLASAEEQLLSALTAARSSALENARLVRELEAARSKWAAAESDAARTRSIEESLSWKITGPIRRVHEWLGNPFCR
ncbi:methyltransferase domain-containing protein [Nibricoccus sp. IMCC34717]|uniref:methyltransferase domain-containing protein n=1 Tax=Nibricoccus sp. IMCC34717 TaxID=3034021 RepID=UPI00384C8F1B